MSETTQTPAEASDPARVLAEERAMARAWKAINDKADPMAVREALEALPAADRVRVADEIAAGLERRASKTGDYAEMERVLPFLPGQGPRERAAIEAETQAETRATTPSPAGPAAPLSPDAQTVYQAVSRLLETRQIVAAEDLKAYTAAALGAREASDGPVALTPDIRLAAGKPPVHTLDEMREVFAAVRERAAAPSDRMAPETAAEVRESLQHRVVGARSMVELMKLYGEDDTQRAIKSLDAHPDQQRLLTAAMEATGKRLLAEDRVKLGLDEPAERRRARGRQDAPADGPVPMGDTPGITITRRGDNGAPAFPVAAERAADPLARDYDIREKGDERRYHRRDDGALAIRATEAHIHGVLRDVATIGAMLDIAQARGWDDVQIKGDRETSRLAWIEAASRGLKAEGYRPTRDDVHAVEQRRAERREQGLEAPPDPAGRSRAGDDASDTPRRETRSGRAERQDRDAWISHTGGLDALTERQQQHAERSYTNWAAANPELAEKHGLRDYVGYVQEKQAERRREREEQRHPVPPKVELPRRSLGL